MVTSVADTLFNRLIDAFPADRDYRSRDISREPMPAPVRSYLEHRMAEKLNELADLRSAAVDGGDLWIDIGHPDVASAAGAYRSALSRHVQIPADAWRDELARACRHAIAYLVRPVPALVDFVYEKDANDAAWTDVAERLAALPAYSYFRDVISAYAEQKGVDRIGRDRFTSLARRIDHQMVRDFDADDWMKLLAPLLDILSQVPEYFGGMPVDVLADFLDEKGAAELHARLETRFRARGEGFITRQQLHDVFEQEAAEEEKAEPVAVESARTQPAADRSERENDGSHVPLWKQFESGLHPSSPSPSEATPASPRGADVPGTANAQPLWKQFRGSDSPSSARVSTRDAAAQPGRSEAPVRKDTADVGRSASGKSTTREAAAPESDVHREHSAPKRSADPYHPDWTGNRHGSSTGRPRDRIGGLDELEFTVLGDRGARNRDLFLRHLFSGSEDDYEDTLRKLSVAESWSEASQIIAREVFLKHQVNIYSDPAVAFTDAAEARFSS